MSNFLRDEIENFQKGKSSQVVLSDNINNWRVRITFDDNETQARIYNSNYTDSKLRMGCFCSIASGVMFFLGENHNVERVTTYLNPCITKGVHDNRLYENWGMSDNGDIIVGNDVWIGHGVKIMSGVNIGTGAVIASNSLVTKNVLPYTIVGGVPSKPIKKRFDDDTIKDLLDSKWWDIPYEKLEPLEDLMYSKNIKGFLSAVKQLKSI